MGKVDDMRALREQIRAERLRGSVAPSAERARSSAGEGSPERGAVPRSRGQRPGPVEVAAPTKDAGECGHTAIGGKRCIRPKDHPEKSHRYAKTT